MDKAIDMLERIILPSSVTTTSTDPGQRPGFTPNLTPLVQVLMGVAPLSPKVPLSSGEVKFLDAALNDSQKEAVTFALEAAELALVSLLFLLCVDFGARIRGFDVCVWF